MDLGLRGKVCIVTGSTAGIGLAVAQRLKDEGASVVTSGRRDEGIGDLHVSADLTQRGEPERLVAATLERFGRLDGLVNNVGGADVRKLDDLTDADWQSVVRAEPDERRACDARGAPRAARGGPRRDRQRLLERRQAALAEHARLLGDEGGAAFVLAARRRRACG